MSIFGAMTTAISGLRAQSTALGHISDNIANTQTLGFKRTETSFAELVSSAGDGSSNAVGSVTAGAKFTANVQGTINTSDTNTHMAVNGDGFFVVAERVGTVDNEAVFLGADRYTRRGDFELNKDGFLVNGAGYYLKGLPVDPTTGNVTGDLPELIQIEGSFLPAQATATIDYSVNLAKFPQTANTDPLVPNSEIMLSAPFTNDPTTITGGVGDGFVQAAEEQLFLDRSLAGGAVTTFDASGSPVSVQLRWAKIDNAADVAGTGLGDTWNLFYKIDSGATGTSPLWQNFGVDYVFDNSGQLNPAIASTTITGLTIDGVNIGDVLFDYGQAGITQFSDSNGVVRVTDLDQDGFPSGELTEIAIGESGRVVGTYSNGRTADLAEVTLAQFSAPNDLRKLDGGAFAATPESGDPLFASGQAVVSGATEGSNVDLATEFSKLIVTQQAYAAGTRIVTTSDEMIQETLNMKR